MPGAVVDAVADAVPDRNLTERPPLPARLAFGVIACVSAGLWWLVWVVVSCLE